MITRFLTFLAFLTVANAAVPLLREGLSVQARSAPKKISTDDDHLLDIIHIALIGYQYDDRYKIIEVTSATLTDGVRYKVDLKLIGAKHCTNSKRDPDCHIRPGSHARKCLFDILENTSKRSYHVRIKCIGEIEYVSQITVYNNLYEVLGKRED